jgi:hypothetical protein
VIYDRGWLLGALSARGLVLRHAKVPEIHGFQWHLRVGRARSGETQADLAPDNAPAGRRPPPAGISVPGLS